MAAKNYTEILALVNAGNQMGLSNTIKRDYGIPLDFTSVQPTYNDAVIYAAENTKAYVGQPLSVGGKLYIINDVAAEAKYVIGEKEYDNYLVEVGSATEGDGATIDLENGVLTLHGFEGAASGYLPRKAEDGTIEWVSIDDIITVTHPEYAIAKDERAEGDTTTTYHLTKDGENVDVEIVVPDAYDDTALAEEVREVAARLEAFLEGTGTEEALDSLQELIEYINTHDDVDIAGILESLQAIETKLTLGTYLDSEEEKQYATVKEYVEAEIAALNIGDYAKAADVYTKTEVNTLIGIPGTPEEGEEGTEDYKPATPGTGVYANVYSKAEVTDLIADITGGESAADVLAELTKYKTENDARVLAVENINTSQGNAIHELQNEITPLKSTVEEHASQIAKNTADIAAHLTRITNLENTKTDHATRIAVLEGLVGHEADGETEASGLIKAVADNVTAIGVLRGELAGIDTAYKAADAELTTLISNNTKKFADYYTKTQVDDALSYKLEAKDLADYAKKADLDDYATIGALDGIANSLAAEVDRAKKAEQSLDDAIKLLTNGAGTDEIDSVNELIDYVKKHGPEVTGILNRLEGIGGEGEPATVMDAIQAAAYTLPVATAAALGGVKSAIADADGNYAANTIIVDTNGYMEAKKISTDILVNGVEDFILYGGNAGVD